MNSKKLLTFTVEIEYEATDEYPIHLKNWWARDQIAKVLEVAHKAGVLTPANVGTNFTIVELSQIAEETVQLLH